MVHNFLPHHHYLHHFHLLHSFLPAQVQEDVLRELDVCGRQDDNYHCLAPSHDPVGDLSKWGDAPDKSDSSHEGQAIHIWWEANERFLPHCLPLRS